MTDTRKKNIRNYIILAAFTIILIFGCIIWGIGVGQQFAKYNHGIHAADEGRWVLTCVDKHGTYTYTCDRCHEQLNSWTRLS